MTENNRRYNVKKIHGFGFLDTWFELPREMWVYYKNSKEAFEQILEEFGDEYKDHESIKFIRKWIMEEDTEFKD